MFSNALAYGAAPQKKGNNPKDAVCLFFSRFVDHAACTPPDTVHKLKVRAGRHGSGPRCGRPRSGNSASQQNLSSFVLAGRVVVGDSRIRVARGGFQTPRICIPAREGAWRESRHAEVKGLKDRACSAERRARLCGSDARCDEIVHAHRCGFWCTAPDCPAGRNGRKPRLTDRACWLGWATGVH